MTEVVRPAMPRDGLRVGFRDRGVLARGFKADVNVIDPEEIGMRGPRWSLTYPPGVSASCNGPPATSTPS